MISSAQIKAARALLGISQMELADKAGVSVPTIRRMEAATDVVGGSVDTLTKVVSALSALGIELIGENGSSLAGGRGVRLK